MPILPDDITVSDRVRKFGQRLDYALNSAMLASVLVLLMALAFWLIRLEIQYVLGAFLVYAAQRLAQKRVSPTVLQVPESQPRPRPVRDATTPKVTPGPYEDAI